MREFVPGDSDDLYRLNSDPRVMRFIGDGKPVSRARHADIMRRVLGYGKLYPDLGFWYTTRRDTGAFIGWFTLKYCGKSPMRNRVHALPEAWGQGFATEGATAMVRYGFDDLDLARIIGVTHPRNLASQNVLQKVALARSRLGTLLRPAGAALCRGTWQRIPLTTSSHRSRVPSSWKGRSNRRWSGWRRDWSTLRSCGDR
jgi:RimJ/RimL family protein N-acetyltransferase